MKNVKQVPLLILLIALVTTLLISCKDDAANKLNPVITWVNPVDINFGTVLTTIQLNATADVPGIFNYTPAIGTKLNEGVNQNLKVDFIPTDPVKYNTVSKTVTINIKPGGTNSAIFNSSLTYGSVTDIEGNSYKTIMIGTQTWMAENLRTTKYRNGENIAEVTDNTAWKLLVTSAYSNYANTTDLNKIATYGRLYNWFAVNDSRNIAPVGWHVATTAEWTTLTTFLSGENISAGKMKESGTSHWNAPNTAADNSTGFTALPAGRREYTDGSFINTGFNGFWWTSSPYNPDYSWYRQMNYDGAFVNPANFHKQYGFSVRCVKD